MTTAVAAAPKVFQYVEEQDAFLTLFPHRYDYLWADAAPLSGVSNPQDKKLEYKKPQWKTERRFPLSDRMIQTGHSLYGVRFGRDTQYCLLDIDIGSRFHPRQEPFALTPILEALENLGLITPIVCISSASGGIHLYFPFNQSCPSWLIGLAITQTLKESGIWVAPGQVEVFPNARTAELSRDSHPALFNGHRLPLQEGSYLLDSDLQPLGSDRQSFVSQWQFCAAQNQLNTQTLRKVAYGRHCTKRLHSQRVKKFLNDLNVEIEDGWTGPGQTNRLLGRIAMRSYIFHHVTNGGEPLEDQALVDNIVSVARSLPGYQEWCQHQHEIVVRATEWARAVEKSHYFHYGDRSSRERFEKGSVQPIDQASDLESLNPQKNWNSQQAAKTQIKIKETVKQLRKQNQFPNETTLRFKTLTNQGIGGASLYKYKELWHPDYLDLTSSELGMETFREDTLAKQGDREPEREDTRVASQEDSGVVTSLFEQLGCNPFQGKCLEDFQGGYLASNFVGFEAPPHLFKQLRSFSIDEYFPAQLVFIGLRVRDSYNIDCLSGFLFSEKVTRGQKFCSLSTERALSRERSPP